LGGNWKKKDSHLNEIYSWQFYEGNGKFRIYKIKENENDALEKIRENLITLKILKTKQGFIIDYSNNRRYFTWRIKYLDSVKLITVRRDGKEAELYKVEK